MKYIGIIALVLALIPFAYVIWFDVGHSDIELRRIGYRPVDLSRSPGFWIHLTLFSTVHEGLAILELLNWREDIREVRNE